VKNFTQRGRSGEKAAKTVGLSRPTAEKGLEILNRAERRAEGKGRQGLVRVAKVLIFRQLVREKFDRLARTFGV